MLDFLNWFFVLDFDWTWKNRSSFLSYSLMIFFSVFSLYLIIYWINISLETLQINHCLWWYYCFENEKKLWEKVEIFKHILFIMMICFVFRLNTAISQRFSFLRLKSKFENIFLIIINILRIITLSFIIFFIINLIWFFYGQNYYYFSDILWQLNSFLLPISILQLVFFLQIILFLIWMILPNPKK